MTYTNTKLKIILVLFIVSLCNLQCVKDLDELIGKKVNINLSNETGKLIKKVSIFAVQNDSNKPVLLDSLIEENLISQTIKTKIFNNNNLKNFNGQFTIKAKFENGKIIENQCCYFANGSFLVKNLTFSIVENEIYVKSE